jgi:transcriptional regulator with XRE-family HTH domain
MLTTGLDKFGNRLKELLKERNMTYCDLALEMLVSEYTISNYCRGKTEPTYSNIKLMAKILAVSSDYLLGLTTNKYGAISADVTLDDIMKTISDSLNEKYNKTLGFVENGAGGNSMMYCRLHNPVMDSGIYPRNDSENLAAILPDLPTVAEHRYFVHKNIYFEANYTNGDESILRWYCADISVYEYVNEGHSMEHLKQAYETERFSMGMLGALSADEFYWLNYVLGYFLRDS